MRLHQYSVDIKVCLILWKIDDTFDRFRCVYIIFKTIDINTISHMCNLKRGSVLQTQRIFVRFSSMRVQFTNPLNENDQTVCNVLCFMCDAEL